MGFPFSQRSTPGLQQLREQYPILYSPLLRREGARLSGVRYYLLQLNECQKSLVEEPLRREPV